MLPSTYVRKMSIAEPDKVTPEALVDLLVPQNVRLSPDASNVVYSISPSVASLSPIVRAGEHTLSSLWTAEAGKKSSARQITSGLFNDQLPQWSPGPSSEGCIAFVSDRAKPGDSCAIYFLSFNGGEAYPLTKAENKKQIAGFKWSPDGRFIAFLSPSEKSEEQGARDKETGGAKVYGEDWDCNRLRCLHVATKEVETISKVDVHVTDFAWNEEGTEIALIAQRTPEISAAGYQGVEFQAVNIATKAHKLLGEQNFPGPARELVWVKNNVYFLAGASPDKANSSSTVYQMSVIDGDRSMYSHGSHDCAVGLRKSDNLLVVHSQKGLTDSICTIDPKDGYRQLAYGDSREIHNYDGVISNSRHEFSLAFATSDCKNPSEVFSYTSPFIRDYSRGDSYCLSEHGSSVANLEIGDHTPIFCTASDGTECDGILIRPAKLRERSPMPTIVFVHGGPYSRITCAFNLLYFYWVPYLVSAGYTVLCPNYRGGSSHGDHYASQARGGMGMSDYDDVISLVKESVSQGFVDQDRVAIGGYSQGGFLSFLAVTRQDFHFKAAICGAGVSDFDSLTMSSDAPWFEEQLAGKAPWGTSANDIKARHGSPIWHMKDVKTPVLILHGEEDVRVPISQSVAFHRGCLHYGVPCEFVTYPREGHVIKEREHLIDMLKRIRRFCDLHLR